MTSPWTDGQSAEEKVIVAEAMITADIVDDVIRSIAQRAGNLTEREAFRVVMSALDASTLLIVKSFSHSDDEAVDVIVTHAAHMIGRIVRAHDAREEKQNVNVHP